MGTIVLVSMCPLFKRVHRDYYSADIHNNNNNKNIMISQDFNYRYKIEYLYIGLWLCNLTCMIKTKYYYIHYLSVFGFGLN